MPPQTNEPPAPPPDLFSRRPLLVLLLLTLAFYWKLALSLQFTFLDTPDLAYQVLPWYQHQARALGNGEFPLWDPNQWSGQPLVGQMQPGAAFPLNWPLFLTPLKNGYLDLFYVHRHFVLMHFLAAVFMYGFCRQIGSSRFAAVLAGAAFSFGGYLGATPWPQMLHGAMWIPLIFLFFHRLVDQGWGRAALSNAALCGASIGLSILSGHHQAPLFTGLALSGVFVYFLYRGGTSRRKLAALFAVVILFAALLGAAQMLPAWEYGARAYRWVGTDQPVRMQEPVPYYAQYNYGIFPLSLLGTLFPKAYLTTDPFLGFVCLSFAFFAVVAGWRETQVRLYAGLAMGALAYAIGHYSLFHGLLYSLTPFLDKAGSPGHAIFIFQFAALALCARGLDLFLGPPQAAGQHWRERIVKALVSIGLLGWALLFWLYLNLKMETNSGDHVALSSLVALLLAALLHALHQGNLASRAWQLAVILLMMFELSIANYFFLSHQDDPKRALHLKKLTEHAGLLAYLKAQPGPFRFDVASPQDFPANLGDWEGLENTRGYLASVSADLFDFLGWDWTRSTLVLNTVYIIARAPTRPQQREVYVDPSGWKVFRNEDALPRAWVTHQLRQARDSREAGQIFRSADFNPRRETILIGGSIPAPRIEPCASDSTVQITRRRAHRLEALSRTSCPGLAVFAETHFPGWQARLDGHPVPIYAPFGALRGVAVPAGEHTIAFLYRPASVYAGAAISLLGLLGCGALAWLAHRAAGVGSAEAALASP